MASSKQTAGGHQHWHLSSIQVQAFKSFAAGSTFNVPTPHLAGIVGPNGCGKSNLLEAICFAAAGSTGVLRLTGRSLADVTSTDAGSQRPEVRLHISKGKTTHVLEACLTPEGGRSYKIDGKLKTGTQVKDFLKARGIVIDSTTVIQQAAVTGLSDSNNALALAQLVAGASGLSSWNQETAAARQEVARTHKALMDIQGNIDKVQSSVAAEGAALKAAAEAAQLEQQLEQQVQELLRGLQQRQELLEQELQDRQQEEQRLEAADAACADQLQHQAAQRKALATQQATIMLQVNKASLNHDSNASSSSGSLCKQVAAAEAQVSSVQTAIAVRAQWAADLQQKQQLQQQQSAQCELLQHRLAAKQAEAAGIRSNLAAVKSGADAAAALQQQAQDAAAALTAVQQQEELLAAKQQEVQHADSKAQFLLQEWQALAQQPANPTSEHTHSQPDQATGAVFPATTAQTDYIITSATAAASAAATAVESHMQQLQGLQQQHMRLQMQAQAAERTLTPAATAGLLAQLGSSCSTLPLHACFRLKDTASSSSAAAATSPQQLEQLLTPLSAIAGPAVLQTLVAPSVSETNRLLAAAAAGAGGAAGSNRRLKVWPLDNLSVHDLQRQQRAAQQQLGQHAVLLPLDLLEFEAAHRPALLRAFGGFVIAADDATAAVLVERYGLSAVTLQGTVSRKGSMTGGWTGSSGSTARTYWSNKHRHDQAQRQLSACRHQLSEAEGRAQALQRQRAAAEAALAAAQQRRQLLGELLEAQAEAAAVAVAREQQQQVLTELQDRAAGLQQRLQQYKVAFGEGAADACADSRGGSSRSSSVGGAAGGKAVSVVLQQQLQAEADRAAAAASTAEQQLEQAQEQAEELAASIEALEVRLAGAQDPQQQEAALQACVQDLHQLQQQQASEAAAGEALREQLRQLQQQQEQLDQQVKAAVQGQKAVQKQAAQAAQAVKGAEAALHKLGVERKQALRDFNDTDAVHAFSSSGVLKAAAAAADAAVAASGGAVPTEGHLQQMGRRARQLQGKLSRLDVPQLLPGQKEALIARLGQAAEFTAQADALKAAAAGLEGQVRSDAEQVYAANNVVFEVVAAGFSQLCSSLLPSLELQLVRVASLAHEGLQFRFRRLQDDAAAAADTAADATWQSSLGQLSGGQRTLVSLAMLLAVARAGGTCGLLLLDEIDAALDEVNQARVSALLRQLAHDRASACQVLCVTHNAGFQGSCDGFVRVTKSAAGHSVPADAEQQQQEAVRPAAGAAGGGKAGRKGAKQGKGPAAAGGAGKAKRVRFSVGG